MYVCVCVCVGGGGERISRKSIVTHPVNYIMLFLFSASIFRLDQRADG